MNVGERDLAEISRRRPVGLVVHDEDLAVRLDEAVNLAGNAKRRAFAVRRRDLGDDGHLGARARAEHGGEIRRLQNG